MGRVWFETQSGATYSNKTNLKSQTKLNCHVSYPDLIELKRWDGLFSVREQKARFHDNAQKTCAKYVPMYIHNPKKKDCVECKVNIR